MNIGVIGCGNMASAVINGIYNFNKELNFKTYTPSHTKAEKLATEVNGVSVETLNDLQDCDVIFIGCKPQQLPTLAKDLEGVEKANITFISMLAAVSIEDIQKCLNTEKIVRLMPSIPMKYNEGISLLLFPRKFDSHLQKKISNWFLGCSQVEVLSDEDLFNKLTVITASGPAYVYYFTEVFERIIYSWGVEKDTAKKLAIKLFKGSSIAMEMNPISLTEQVAQVTSKKGVTIEAIDYFKENDLDSIFKEAVLKALLRSDEIEQELKTLK